MTPEEINLVKSSWDKVMPIADAAADLFYTKLFELNPGLQPLFKGDMKEQGHKLMMMINAAVGGLGSLDSIIPAVQRLGKRHVEYGVTEDDYNTMGSALIWMLEKGLGIAFTDDIRDAWSNVYTLLSSTMKNAAAESAA